MTEFQRDKQQKDGLSLYCKPCKNAVSEKWRLANPDKHRARVAKWRAENLERGRELDRQGHHRRKAKRNEESRRYRAENTEKMRALCRAWAKNNPERAAEINADRRAAKLRAIPTWGTSEFDKLVVGEAYRLAKLRTVLTNVVWHVDHRVPLRSSLVCGLHCAANIQVITASQNHSKNNLVWEDMPH